MNIYYKINNVYTIIIFNNSQMRYISIIINEKKENYISLNNIGCGAVLTLFMLLYLHIHISK